MGDYVVYIHQNKTNGKRYVGITNNTSKRWYGKGKKYENCPRFWSAIQKYGWDNFTHTVVVRGLTLEESNAEEQRLINEYQTQDRERGYNINPGGDFVPTMLGKKHKESTKQIMREKALGRVVSEDQKRRHSERMTGKMVGSKNHKSKAVVCTTTGEIFESQAIAARTKNVNQSKISLCCQGKRTHTHGLKWAYADGTGV